MDSWFDGDWSEGSAAGERLGEVRSFFIWGEVEGGEKLEGRLRGLGAVVDTASSVGRSAGELGMMSWVKAVSWVARRLAGEPLGEGCSSLT